MIKRVTLAFCFMAAISLSVSAQASLNAAVASDGNMGGQEKKSLYVRLGGYDAIALVTDDFVSRLIDDKNLAKFFGGHSQDSLKKIRMHVINQLCEVAGGPCNYTGRDMRTAHKGLGITGADWDEAVKHLVATLDKFKVPKTEKDELLAAISGLKKDIVDKP